MRGGEDHKKIWTGKSARTNSIITIFNSTLYGNLLWFTEKKIAKIKFIKRYA